MFSNSNWIAATMQPIHSGDLGGQFDDPDCESCGCGPDAEAHLQSTNANGGATISRAQNTCYADECVGSSDVGREKSSFRGPASSRPYRYEDRRASMSRGAQSAPNDAPAADDGENFVPDTEVTQHDVLCGRGGGTNHHAGNKFFRWLCDEYRPTYVNPKGNGTRKIDVVRTILASIRSNGGRFLRKHGKGRRGWVDIGERQALSKTSQAMRDGMAESKKKRAVKACGVKAEFYLGEVVQHQQPPLPESDQEQALREARSLLTIRNGGDQKRQIGSYGTLMGQHWWRNRKNLLNDT